MSLTDEAAGWVSEWRKLGEHRQLRLITACVLACGENSVVIHLLRSLRAAAEPEAKAMRPDYEPSPEQLQAFNRGGIPGNETCLYCGKHISQYYGGTDYRCYPRNI